MMLDIASRILKRHQDEQIFEVLLKTVSQYFRDYFKELYEYAMVRNPTAE